MISVEVYVAMFIINNIISLQTDIMELKRMMERLGQAKTHLELKKMIAEVDKTNSGDI